MFSKNNARIKYIIIEIIYDINTFPTKDMHNFIFSLINQLLGVLLPLITAPYVARVLGSVGNGQFSYATSIAQYFVVFSSLGFASYGQREIAKCGDNLKKRSKVFFEIFLMRLLPSFFSLVTFLIPTSNKR